VLTAYGYEISRAHRERVRRYHFIHIAKTDGDGRISYYSYPILLNYLESEHLRAIAAKIFKGLRGFVQRCLLKGDQVLQSLGEVEAFNYVFGASNLMAQRPPPYDMVLVLKDDSRWRLDPH
jgi:hypothetical protein